MKDPNRIDETIEVMKRIWKKNPQLRLCQLIGNIFSGDNYHIEDDVLVSKLKEVYEG